MITLALHLSAAYAWDWNEDTAPTGDSLTWKMCADDFTAAQQSEITWAAQGWTAGTGAPMRGAIWSFVRGADRSICGLNNGHHEVYQANDAWFTAHGLGSSVISYTFNDPSQNDVDIVFRSSVPWVNLVPASITNSTDRSIGQVALHEFGHALGFNDDNGVLATMNAPYPHGGDISGHKYRPNENDYAGLKFNRPHSSTGTNLMLTRWESTTSGGTRELWQAGGLNWNVCDTVVARTSGPEQIYGLAHTTSNAYSVYTEWRLSTDTTCFSPFDPVVGYQYADMASEIPYLLWPNSWNFSNVAAGQYYLCAKINPNSTITESTTAADNDLRSTSNVTVQDCP